MSSSPRILLTIGGFISICCISLLILDKVFPPDLSRYGDLSQELFDEQGKLLHVIQSRDDKWRLKCTLDQVDQSYLDLLLAREDQYFWSHPGVNPISLLRASYQFIKNNRIISGGSTITMQVARLLSPAPKSLKFKLIQILRAFQLELRYSKEQILEMYLTLAPYGSNLEGIRSASLAYFGKDPYCLTPSEAALLIVLPQRPRLWRRSGFAAETMQLKNNVLFFALENKLIDKATYNIAARDQLPDSKFALPRELPHLSRRLFSLNQTKQPLISTVDFKLQKQIEFMLKEASTVLPHGANIAVMVVHHPTNKVVGYIASADFYDAKRDGQVDFIQAYRSPGSTLKPFIYAMGFDRGYLRPDSFVLDDRKRFGTYMPDNFDKEFYGMVTASEALVMSLNVPVVHLLNQIGPQRFAALLEEAGTPPKFLDPHTPPGLSMALGGMGMTLEQVVTLYSAMAQGGIVKALKYTPGDSEETITSLMSGAAAASVTGILAHTLVNEIGIPSKRIAVKTGTSYGHRDAWAIGYDQNHVVGIWIGKPSGESLGMGTGYTLVVPIVEKVFRFLPHSSSLKQDAVKTDLVLKDAVYENVKRKKLYNEIPRMLFPLDGTVIEKTSHAIVFHAHGGKRPYTWFVDGQPMGVNIWKSTFAWRPVKAGFYKVTLMDALGKSQSADIEIN